MRDIDREIEAKFYIQDLNAFEDRLLALGSHLLLKRVHETNLRFDTAQKDLSRNRQVMRLRKDTKYWMTYKAPVTEGKDTIIRQEIEFEVSDFKAARQFIEALGYELFVKYEKFRTTYEFYNVLVTLDEMPYGNFIEIEGPDVPTLQVITANLKLDWNARCETSYLDLFYRLKKKRNLKIQHLSFEEFVGLKFEAEDFDLRPADDIVKG
ncbi:MAG: class IV adenylate cyclase [Anaerolineaceae bacterium]|nr:class IV adenylate cyclase [Anaerolineaceae bacterium]